MDYFPLFLNLKQQPCLVVGGGTVAARRVEALLEASAHVDVVSLAFCDSLQALQQHQAIRLITKAFAPSDVTDYRLVVAATCDAATNQAIAQAAQAQAVWVNVVDSATAGDCIFPAIIDRSPVIAAVCTAGASPVLTRLLRAKLESAIPMAFGQLAQLAQRCRDSVKQRLPHATQRRQFWETVFQGPIAEQVFAGNMADAERMLHLQLSAAEQSPVQGEVYLIGAGPGDPDLLTFKALRLMQQADVIVYDRLVSPEVLALARRDAEKRYVGKQRSNHSLPQASINTLLADLALAGKRVARLKGGDPFIFGRGGEEIETLMQQGIPFQVVPGITAAAGCASYAGIPLTHRDHAQSCTFVTGHLKDGSIDLNWQQLAAPHQTVVIYMGLVGLATICQQLIAHGCSPHHPIAIVQQGTTQQQRVLSGTLSTLAQQVEDADIKPPTLIIIGTVVQLQPQLQWFGYGNNT